MVIKIVRTVFVVAAAWLVGHTLSAAGWPWYTWLPAAFLAGLVAGILWFSLWFLIRKLTYPGIARTQRNGTEPNGQSPDD